MHCRLAGLLISSKGARCKSNFAKCFSRGMKGTAAVFSGVSVGGLISFGIGRKLKSVLHDVGTHVDRVDCMWPLYVTVRVWQLLISQATVNRSHQ